MTEVWGPTYWRLLHTLSENFISNDQKNFFEILFKDLLTECIPCRECRNEYYNFITQLKFNYLSFKFKIYEFHTFVSDKIGKDTYRYNHKLYLNSYTFTNNKIANLLKELYSIYQREEYEVLDKIIKLIEFINNNKYLLNNIEPPKDK